MAATLTAIRMGPEWLVVSMLALGSCGHTPEKAAHCSSTDLLVIAAREYRAHVPAETLRIGDGKLTFSIEDVGDRWSVSVSPYRDRFRHNMIMSIRKSDRQVSGIEVRNPRTEG